MATWPKGYNSAVLVSFELEQASPSDIRDAVNLLRRHEAKGTFFVVSGYYEDSADTLGLIREFEAASKGWNQSEWSDDPVVQVNSIKRSRNWLMDQGFDPAGFRAPFLKSDQETVKILSEQGFEYDSSGVGLFPETGSAEMIEIPLSLAYDPFWSTEVENYLPILYLVFEETYKRGGLFHFYTYPEHADEKLEIFMEYLSTKDVWFASGEEILDWWEKRAKVTVEVNGDVAMVTNHGDKSVSGLALKYSGGLILLDEIMPKDTLSVEL